MPFWTRQLPDGKRAPGFGVYLVGVGVASSLVLYAIWGRPGGVSFAGPPRTNSSAKVSGIGKAVEGVSKVEQAKEADAAARLGSSTRVEQQAPPSAAPAQAVEEPPPSTGAIFTALEHLRQSEAPKDAEAGAPLPEGGPSPGGYMPPGAPPVPKIPLGTNGDQQARQAGSLVAYRRPTPTAAQAGQTAAGTASRVPTGFDTGEFLPRGHEIEAYLLTRIETGNLETLVTLGVASNVVHNGRVLLPMGTRLLGSSAGQAVRDRIPVRIDTVLYPNGDELPISAVVRDADKMTGVRSYYIPPPTWVQMAPYVNDFLSAYLAIVAQNQQRGISVQLGDVRVQPQVPTFDPKAEAINATSKAIQTFSERQMNELSRRYAATNVVPPGTRVWVVLQSATDFTKRGVGAGRANPTPILPGFENNVIAPNGIPDRTASSERQQGTLSAAMVLPAAQRPETPAEAHQ